jgi:hypothetical protein
MARDLVIFREPSQYTLENYDILLNSSDLHLLKWSPH